MSEPHLRFVLWKLNHLNLLFDTIEKYLSRIFLGIVLGRNPENEEDEKGSGQVPGSLYISIFVSNVVSRKKYSSLLENVCQTNFQEVFQEEGSKEHLNISEGHWAP